MARNSQQPAPLQTALRGLGTAALIGAFFLAVCLCSAATAKSAAILLTALTLSAAFLFWERLRDRVKAPVAALALVVLMSGISCSYAASGKFALYEFLKVFNAFCLMLMLLAFTGEERPERKISVILEGFAAVAGLTSIDLLSTRWVSGAVLGALGWFTPDYMELGAVEEGVRMTSIFLSPNVFAGCMGVGVLLALGLAVTEEKPGARAGHLACLSVNALSFVLAFSMGACVMIVPAFLALLALTGGGKRTELFLLMLETLAVTALCAFPISLTSMTAWTGFQPIPLLCAAGGAAVLCGLDLLAVSAVCLWRGRKRPLAPALGAALVFMACHALVEFTFSIYCYLPMAFGVFAAISLCCGDTLPLPAWMEGKTVKNGAVLGICALLVLFAVLLGCNSAARGLVTDPSNLDQLERAAALDPFERADYLLTYVIQAGGREADGEVREKADEYAARLAKLDSNSIPIYLAEYYLRTGRTEQGLEQAERYVGYVSADAAVWQKTFDLLEEYEEDTEQYRAGVRRVAELLDAWNAENLGRIELSGQTQAFIGRMCA